MKQWKRISVAVLLVAVCILAAGCSKKVTVKSLFIDANKNAEKMKSMDMDFVMDLACEIEAQGESAEIGMTFDVNTKSEKEKGMALDGDVEVNFAGSKMSVPVKSYRVLDGEDYTAYTYDGDEDAWTYSEGKQRDKDESTENGYAVLSEGIGGFNFSHLYEKLTLAEELETYNGKECYKVSGKFNASEVEELLESIGKELESNDIDKSAAEYVVLDAEFYFEKEFKNLVGLKMDLADSDWEEILKKGGKLSEEGLASVFGTEVSFKVSEMDMEFKVNSYDDYTFELPKDVKEEATEDDSKSEKAFIDFGNGTSETDF